MKKLGLVVSLVLALVVGLAIGSASASSAPVSDPTPTPRTTVTLTAVPAECRTALGYASDGFDIASKTMDIVGRAVVAAAAGDSNSLLGDNGELTTQTRQMTALAPKYLAAREACLRK